MSAVIIIMTVIVDKILRVKDNSYSEKGIAGFLLLFLICQIFIFTVNVFIAYNNYKSINILGYITAYNILILLTVISLFLKLRYALQITNIMLIFSLTSPFIMPTQILYEAFFSLDELYMFNKSVYTNFVEKPLSENVIHHSLSVIVCILYFKYSDRIRKTFSSSN